MLEILVRKRLFVSKYLKAALFAAFRKQGIVLECVAAVPGPPEIVRI
tara:strand:- start:11 stop:151 length:141 start_codon:yes stop_codon:yes gene_type:complete